MLFNTYQFAIFFAILFPVYWLLRRLTRLQNVLLLGAGYYFYACWNPRFLALLVLSTVMDYACGLWVDRAEEPRRRRAIVAASMAMIATTIMISTRVKPPRFLFNFCNIGCL